jgi:hypothetical protein
LNWSTFRAILTGIAIISGAITAILGEAVRPEIIFWLRSLSKKELSKGGRPPRKRPSYIWLLFIASILITVLFSVFATFEAPPLVTYIPSPTPTLRPAATHVPKPSSYTPVPLTQTATYTPRSLPSPTTDGTKSTQTEITIAISEVMFDACGDPNEDRTNEYIEIVNYGNAKVDLHNFWISDRSSDPIVPWSEALPWQRLPGKNTNSSWYLPPGEYGLILSPEYNYGSRSLDIEDGTFIFTTTNRNLGDGGYVGSDLDISERDILMLYVGSENKIDVVVSTYGSPYGIESHFQNFTNPRLLKDNDKDTIPLYQGDCNAIQREVISGEDTDINWEKVYGGSPGYHAVIENGEIVIPSTITPAISPTITFTRTFTPSATEAPTRTVAPSSTPTIDNSELESPDEIQGYGIHINHLICASLLVPIASFLGVFLLMWAYRKGKITEKRLNLLRIIIGIISLPTTIALAILAIVASLINK